MGNDSVFFDFGVISRAGIRGIVVESCVSVDAELNSGVGFSAYPNGSVFAQFDVFSGSTLGFGVGRVSSVVWWLYNAIPMPTAVGCAGKAKPH